VIEKKKEFFKIIKKNIKNILAHTSTRFSHSRDRKTQMKTSHISENYDLCHPLLGCENSNNISNKSYSRQQHPTTSNSSSATVTYGNRNSSGDQTTKYAKNANDLQIKQQQRQQEQNKKRKRETGEYSSRTNSSFLLVLSSYIPPLSLQSLCFQFFFCFLHTFIFG
jgi:predicted DNA-binding WGR domain protein